MSKEAKSQKVRAKANHRVRPSAKLDSSAANLDEKGAADPLVKAGCRDRAKGSKKEQFLQKILARMFETVGRRYTPEETGKPEWYRTSTWTDEQESVFKDYLVRELMRTFRLRKPAAVKEAGWFLFFCGWTLAVPTKRPRRTANQSKTAQPHENKTS